MPDRARLAAALDRMNRGEGTPEDVQAFLDGVLGPVRPSEPPSCREAIIDALPLLADINLDLGHVGHPEIGARVAEIAAALREAIR